MTPLELLTYLSRSVTRSLVLQAVHDIPGCNQSEARDDGPTWLTYASRPRVRKHVHELLKEGLIVNVDTAPIYALFLDPSRINEMDRWMDAHGLIPLSTLLKKKQTRLLWRGVSKDVLKRISWESVLL